MNGNHALSGPAQRKLQQERLAEIAKWRDERGKKLAELVGKAAAHQIIWEAGEPWETYLGRLGFDLTKI